MASRRTLGLTPVQDGLLTAAELVLHRCKRENYHGHNEPCGICADHAAAIRAAAGFKLVTDLQPIARSTRRPKGANKKRRAPTEAPHA